MLNKTQIGLLLGGVIVGSVATKVITNLVSSKKQKKQQPKPKQQDTTSPHYQEIKNQQLARVIKFFGQEKFQKLQKSYVIVFGVGGVGSHVVNMLARSGVGRIKIVDFDQVTLSSLNRHSFAMREDVGRSKVQCIQDYVKRILPHVKIQTEKAYVTVQNAASFLQQPVDYIIDCIDNLEAKVQLVALCKEKNIRLIVSGGAGMKSDPTRLQIRDIADVRYDSLTNRLKKELTKKGIKSGVKVAFSYEQTQKQLLPLTQQQIKNPQAFKVFDNYRLRIIPVLGTMPAILGMAIASYVLCDIAGQLYKPLESDYVKSSALNKVYCEFLNDEKRRGLNPQYMQVDMEQMAILTKEVFEWKCMVNDRKQNHLKLVRWNPQEGARIDNLVLLGKESYEKHFKFLTYEQVKNHYSQQIQEKFRQKSQFALKLWKSGYRAFV